MYRFMIEIEIEISVRVRVRVRVEIMMSVVLVVEEKMIRGHDDARVRVRICSGWREGEGVRGGEGRG